MHKPPHWVDAFDLAHTQLWMQTYMVVAVWSVWRMKPLYRIFMPVGEYTRVHYWEWNGKWLFSLASWWSVKLKFIFYSTQKYLSSNLLHRLTFRHSAIHHVYLFLHCRLFIALSLLGIYLNLCFMNHVDNVDANSGWIHVSIMNISQLFSILPKWSMIIKIQLNGRHCAINALHATQSFIILSLDSMN